jgi:hypothetical protein
MSVGVGVDVEVGFSVETTQNTRVAPATFVRILQENLKCEQEFIRSAGLGGGRLINRAKAAGNKTVGGSVSFELGTAELEQLFRLVTFLNPTPSGDDPYTRAYAGFGGTPVSGTWGVNRPYGGGSEYFEYEGSVVNQATLTQNAGEFLTAQLELICYDETTDQTAPTYAPPSDEQLLTFQGVTTTVFSTAECFDGFSLNINHNLKTTPKACAADAGRATVHRGGMASVTGVLNDDFKDMDHYNRYLAGTEGALVFAWAGADSSSITITMNVFFTGETPSVSGPGEVKQGIPFEVISATSDAAAITMTTVNGES